MGIALFMTLDTFDLKIVERYFRFMKLYRGKAIFYFVVAGLLISTSEFGYWQYIIAGYFMIIVVLTTVFACISENESYFIPEYRFKGNFEIDPYSSYSEDDAESKPLKKVII